MRVGEDLNSGDWEEFAQSYALYIGFAMNMAFIIAQANNESSTQYDGDGVFREASGPGWMKWMMNSLVTVLAGACFMNAWLAYGKKRHYRLFEQPIERTPATPSAQRVRVDSSPAGASPMSYFRSVVARNSAPARAHPDATRDVWEIAVWDPNPLALELFCLFSPLHVMLYYFNLPVAPLDPRPSVRVTTTIIIGALLSLQLWWLRSAFTQQIKDNAIISRQVLHEYDSKFVHPALQKQGRDVGIQTISRTGNGNSSVGVKGSSRDLASEVVTYTPTTIIKRAFRTNPNSNYASQYDPDGLRSTQHTPSVRRSGRYTSTSTATNADPDDDFSSPIRPAVTPNPFRTAPSIPRTGDGGSLGVYTHAASPLRKQANMRYRDDDTSRGRDTLTGFADRITPALGDRRHTSPSKREGSPLKRMSMPVGGLLVFCALLEMDPLTITSTCIGLIATTAQASIAVTAFVKDVRDARRDLDGVSRELLSLSSVLTYLRDDTEDEKARTLPDALNSQIIGILANVKVTVLEIEGCLLKCERSKMGKGGYWTLGGAKGEINKLRSSLESHTTALDLALQLVNTTIVREVKKDTTNILEDTAAIKDDTAKIREELELLRARLTAAEAVASTSAPVLQLAAAASAGGSTLVASEDHSAQTSNIMLQRYLDNLTSYADSVCDPNDRDHWDTPLSSSPVSPIREDIFVKDKEHVSAQSTLPRNSATASSSVPESGFRTIRQEPLFNNKSFNSPEERRQPQPRRDAVWPDGATKLQKKLAGFRLTSYKSLGQFLPQSGRAKDKTLVIAPKAKLPDYAALSEMEAAVLVALQRKDINGDALDVGDCVVVYNDRGVSVELMSYKTCSVQPPLIEEYTMGDDGSCGSGYLDYAFDRFIRTIVGEEQWAGLRPRGKARMMAEFRTVIKPCFSGDDTKYFIDLQGVADDPTEGIDDETILLKPMALKTIFDHVVGPIMRLVEVQIDDVQENGGKLTRKGNIACQRRVKPISLPNLACLSIEDALQYVAVPLSRALSSLGTRRTSAPAKIVVDQIAQYSYRLCYPKQSKDYTAQDGRRGKRGQLSAANRTGWLIEKGDIVEERKALHKDLCRSLQVSLLTAGTNQSTRILYYSANNGLLSRGSNIDEEPYKVEFGIK
ncbi:hypothetical protein P153DRAFT_360558 [Dothidotthia symphoricarpi CBS 119687]|uniref:Azaphilone pigments biosynthesis cluster protein L N-terminal domain-containing protein n=1 Tax=Dothidotthia symphoricarpi CBS 119687 TaxID=1392245 RepID=A0A6A5ZZB3_9PLEO|nr:uncharacterized protein P153DRAFT_360558 [Dothidotthia symphoricarpi CBS 119687]KAF2124909.1 hypothetical protein P153DRAFT_360558 [Dothidotthia symphoricarpi CBS 119687]